MTIDHAISLLVSVTLVVMMVALGLRVTWSELQAAVRNGPVVVRTLLANYLCMPLATIGLLMLFQTHELVAAGFLLLAVCPGAPFAPQIARLARGDISTAIGMMVILAISSVIMAPLALYVLLPLLLENAPLTFDPVRLVSNLLMLQFLPLGTGLLIRHKWPVLAGRLEIPANRASLLLNLLSVVGVVATQYPALAAIQPRGFVGMTMLLALSLSAGWLLGGGAEPVRRSLSVTTALRNLGLSLVIANGSFAGTPVPTAVLAYGLFSIAGTVVVASVWGRDRAARKLSVNDGTMNGVRDDSPTQNASIDLMSAKRSSPHTEAAP